MDKTEAISQATNERLRLSLEILKITEECDYISVRAIDKIQEKKRYSEYIKFLKDEE